MYMRLVHEDSQFLKLRAAGDEIFGAGARVSPLSPPLLTPAPEAATTRRTRSWQL